MQVAHSFHSRSSLGVIFAFFPSFALLITFHFVYPFALFSKPRCFHPTSQQTCLSKQLAHEDSLPFAFARKRAD